jgi:predicted kinase
MSKILMLKGLPASGKSTYAKELVSRGGWKRVNKDDLRAMLDDGKWSKGNEKFVVEVRDSIIIDAVVFGQYSVVVDDTNFNPVHEKTLRQIADELKLPFEVLFIDTPLAECIARDRLRLDPVGEKVIKDMYNQYLKPEPTVYIPPTDGQIAIIADLDGTLAHGINMTRKPYEWNKVGTDTVDETVAGIVRTYHKSDIMEDAPTVSIILMSGRDESCRIETIKWLRANNIPFDALFMRPEGDKRKDTIVKKELFENHVRDKYQVLFVLDDRNSVVEMWREMGLKVLQVADGDF